MKIEPQSSFTERLGACQLPLHFVRWVATAYVLFLHLFQSCGLTNANHWDSQTQMIKVVPP